MDCPYGRANIQCNFNNKINLCLWPQTHCKVLGVTTVFKYGRESPKNDRSLINFTHLHVIPDVYGFLSSDKHKEYF